MSVGDTTSVCQVPAGAADATCGKDPPRSLLNIVRSLGPGLIIAGSVVGSGELIATTKVGAEAGITLLWLILIGCVIKVFVQIELGRHALASGETTLTALDQVPGPRLRVNWVVWFWLVMMIAVQAQLGAIVGGVGQALALACPIRGDYAEMITLPSTTELRRYLRHQEALAHDPQSLGDPREVARVELGQREIEHRLESAGPRGVRALSEVQRLVALENRPESKTDPAIASELAAARANITQLLDPPTWDDRYWSFAVALATAALLVGGRYSLVQNLSTALVVAFTFVTVGNVLALQLQTSRPEFHLTWRDIWRGLALHIPHATAEIERPLATALATFGIIGVGSAELVAYPYWCLEKGYARFAGPRDAGWTERARGWMRVMRYDAFASMLVYTVATLAFFFMGVAVMHTQSLDPEGMRMVGTLLEQYVPIFGDNAKWLFLIGAFAVLYSTVLAANAGNARMFADSLRVFGWLPANDLRAQHRWVQGLCVFLPLLQLALYWTRANPVRFVLLGGTMQALMLPLLGISALYFRFKLCDERLRPSRLWDACLVISCLGLFVAGGYSGYTNALELSRKLF